VTRDKLAYGRRSFEIDRPFILPVTSLARRSLLLAVG